VNSAGRATFEILPERFQKMFRLITTVRRGTASNLAPAWARYRTIESARAGASTLLREERVQRVMIVRAEIPQTFVEWVER
jgi:hypothetical protein